MSLLPNITLLGMSSNPPFTPPPVRLFGEEIVDACNFELEYHNCMKMYRQAQRNGSLSSALGFPAFRLKNIPQDPYMGNYKQPNAGSDLQLPIEFWTKGLYGCSCVSHSKGIWLVDAYDGNTTELVGGDQRILLGDSTKVSVRVRAVGYGDHGEQIPSRRATVGQEGKTLAEIVKKVAAIVKHSIDKPANSCKWVINGDTIRFEDLILLELRHVTSGSWQPVLAYADPTFHSYDPSLRVPSRRPRRT